MNLLTDLEAIPEWRETTTAQWREALRREPQYSNVEEDRDMDRVAKTNELINKQLAKVFETCEDKTVDDVMPDVMFVAIAASTLEHEELAITDETWLKASPGMRATLVANMCAMFAGAKS